MLMLVPGNYITLINFDIFRVEQRCCQHPEAKVYIYDGNQFPCPSNDDVISVDGSLPEAWLYSLPDYSDIIAMLTEARRLANEMRH